MQQPLNVEFINAQEIANSAHDFDSFLSSLNGPVVVIFDGTEQSYNKHSCRIVSTLLHANEPSGLKAAFRLAKQGFEAKVKTYIIIASVLAAKSEPKFTHRMLAGQRDLNRCFTDYQNDNQGKIAKFMLDFIEQKQPEAVIDIHNTSGSGPAYGVAIEQTTEHLALTSLFSDRLIVTQMRLGTLMEQHLGCPVVTIEAGGSSDIKADEVALEGLKTFMSKENVFESLGEVDVLSNPCRFEIASDKMLTFSTQHEPSFDASFRIDIEKFNQGITPSGTILGWTAATSLTGFNIKNTDTQIETYFCIENGELKTRLPLKLFMATNRVDIAKSDCLFYFIP